MPFIGGRCGFTAEAVDSGRGGKRIDCDGGRE
jgi:hypothetical protein